MVLPSDSGIVFVGVFARFAEDGFDVRPVASGFDDDEFVSAASLAEFGGVGAGRDADGFFVDESAALGLGGGERGGPARIVSGEQSESKSHIYDYWPERRCLQHLTRCEVFAAFLVRCCRRR